MIHFCICGAFDGRLNTDKKIYVTICGACELKRPTMAKQIIEMRRRAEPGAPRRRSHFFITICGATELKSPTLAEEYLDFKDAIQSGLLTVQEWDSTVAELGVNEGMNIGSFTLCGAFGTCELPEENEEVDGLALHRHLGHIPEEAGTMLEHAVGQDGSQRAALVRRAMAGAHGSPA